MNAMDEREIIGLTTSEDFNGTQRPIPEDRSDRDKTKTNTQRIRLDRKASYLLLYRRSLSSPFGQDFFYKKKKKKSFIRVFVLSNRPFNSPNARY